MTTTIAPSPNRWPARRSPAFRRSRSSACIPLQGPTDTRKRFPGMTCTREFIGGVQKEPGSLIRKVENHCRPSWDAGLTPIYSFKLDRAQVAAGKWDPYLRELAEWHKDHKPAQIVPWHEPENTFTGTDFARYFNRLATVIRGANNKLPLIYSAMGYHWLPTLGRSSGGRTGGSIGGVTDNPADWKVDADLICCDVYSGRSFLLGDTLGTHKGFDRWREHYVGSQPYGITERGFTITPPKNPPPGPRVDRRQVRAEAVKKELAWLTGQPDGQRCSMYIYWATPGAENDEGFLLDDPGSEDAVRQLIHGLAHR